MIYLSEIEGRLEKVRKKGRGELKTSGNALTGFHKIMFYKMKVFGGRELLLEDYVEGPDNWKVRFMVVDRDAYEFDLYENFKQDADGSVSYFKNFPNKRRWPHSFSAKYGCVDGGHPLKTLLVRVLVPAEHRVGMLYVETARRWFETEVGLYHSMHFPHVVDTPHEEMGLSFRYREVDGRRDLRAFECRADYKTAGPDNRKILGQRFGLIRD